jgi:hypothetical protein
MMVHSQIVLMLLVFTSASPAGADLVVGRDPVCVSFGSTR